MGINVIYIMWINLWITFGARVFMTGHERISLRLVMSRGAQDWSCIGEPKTGHKRICTRLVIRARAFVTEITLEMSDLSVSKLDFLIFLW
jgi:hypothetical protein